MQNPRPDSLPDLYVHDLSYDGEGLPQDLRTGRALPFFARDQGLRMSNISDLASVFRVIEPTWRNYIRYVGMEAREGNKDAVRYLAAWDKTAGEERMYHIPEKLCDLAGVRPGELAGWVMKHAFDEGLARKEALLKYASVTMIERNMKFAYDSPENYKHMELFFRAAGLVAPAPPVHHTIYNHPIASSNAVAGVRSESAPAGGSGLQDMDSAIVELSKIMQTEGAKSMRAQEPDEDGELEDGGELENGESGIGAEDDEDSDDEDGD